MRRNKSTPEDEIILSDENLENDSSIFRKLQSAKTCLSFKNETIYEIFQIIFRCISNLFNERGC